VNQKFADAVCSEIDSDDPIVLVQDYHFALLPRLVRQRLPRAQRAALLLNLREADGRVALLLVAPRPGRDPLSDLVANHQERHHQRRRLHAGQVRVCFRDLRPGLLRRPQNQHRLGAFIVVCVDEDATQYRSDAQDIEEVRRDDTSQDAIGIPAAIVRGVDASDLVSITVPWK